MRKYVVTVVITLLSFAAGASCLAQDIFETEKGLYSTAALTASSTGGKQKKLVIKSASTLAGTITITVAQQKDVTLTYYKRARAESRSRAIDYIDLLAVGITTLPEYVRLELRAPNPAPWGNDVESGLIDAEVVVPEGYAVEMEATYYNLVVRGPLRSVVVQSSLGRFDIADVTQELELETKNRRVKIDNITGKISVSTTNAALVASGIDSRGQTAVFRNEGGDIKIDGYSGGINLKNSFGRTVITNFRPSGESNFIRGASGPVTLEITEMKTGQLVVNNRYEDINITIPDTLSGYLSLSVDDEGRIEAVNFPFTADLVERDRLSLSTGPGNVKIIGSIRGKGNIYVRGTKGD